MEQIQAASYDQKAGGMKGGSGILPAFAFLLAGSASAQTPRYRPLPVEEIAATAVVAGVAVVERVSVRKDPSVNAVYTDATLRFEDVWKGEPPPAFVLTRYGGVYGNEKAFSPGWDYDVKPGERIVVFATPFRDGTWTLKGSRQGLFRVEGSPPRARRDLGGIPGDGPEPPTLADLKRRVFAALGREAPVEPAAPPPAAAPGGTKAPDAEAAPRAPEGHAPARAAREPLGGNRWILVLIVIVGLVCTGVAWAASKSRRSDAASG